MVKSSWLRWLRSFIRSKGRTYERSPRRPILEHLETRLAPATFTWTGADAATNPGWTDGKNWSGGVAPQGLVSSLDDLVFPAGVTGKALTSKNDIAPVAGVLPTFNSITISGTGYDIFNNAITLGNPSVYNSGYINVGSGLNNEILNLPITMGGASASTGSVQVFTVNTGSTLTLAGRLSGLAGTQLTKEGGGTLSLTNDNSAFNGPIEIDHDSGAIEISNSTALGTGTVTVEQNSQIEINNSSQPISNSLIINGPGPNNTGALLTIAGSSNWQGAIEMDSDTTFGATTGATMTISGVISDTGSGHNLTKEGGGMLVLAGTNLYRAGTTINNGILDLANAQGLGLVDGSPSSETVVNESHTEAGTLEIDGSKAQGGGLIVQNELLVLNGTGYGTINGTGGGEHGAFYNLDGNNTWHGNVIFGSPAPNGSGVWIDVATGAGENSSSLTVGVIQGDASSSSFFISGAQPLTVNGNVNDTGTLIFPSNNIYTGGTTIDAGSLEIEDSHGQGKPSGATVVQNGATLELAVDNIPDSVTGTVNTLLVSNNVTITGTGVNGVGALYSFSGINTYSGNITLVGNRLDGIGVEPDPNPKTDRTYLALDYHLLVSGNVIGGANNEPSIATNPTLAKVDLGNLILQNASTQFFGATDIQAGWITAENSNSLGGIVSDVGDTIQPTTTVEYGAALTLEPPVGKSLTVPNRFVLYGTGISSTSALFPGLIGATGNGEGALLSLDGQNFVTGNIELGGAAGIGAQSLDAGYPTPGELFIDGPVSQVPPLIAVTGNGSGNEKETDIKPGLGINVGSKSATLTINANTFPDPDDLRIYLGGNKTTGTLVYDSSLLSYPANKPTSANVATITMTYTATGVTAFNVSDLGNNTWNPNLVNGNLTLNFAQPLSSNYIQIVMNQVVNGVGNTDGSAAWTVTAQISPANPNGSIVKLGSQRVILQSPGTYLGGADVQEGVLRVQNSTALGAVGTGLTINGGTSVEPGATLELDSIDASDLAATPYLNGGLPAGLGIYGTPLTLAGVGNDTLLPVVTTAPFPDPLTQTPVQQDPLVNLKGDNLWHDGPIALATSVSIDVKPNSRLDLAGSIGDETISNTPSNLTLDDSGETILAGINSYHGVTNVQQGILTLKSSGALGFADGTASSGTVVANGAQIQIAGSITIAGEVLSLQGGTGVTTQPAIPDSWFADGPSPINNADTPNSQPASGRITGVSEDPFDPNVIYVSTAGGGGWKSEDGGITWASLFDNAANSGFPNGVAPMFTGAIAVDPLNPNVIILGTGESDNSSDSYYGTGVYESIDSGRTWTLLTDPRLATPNPFLGTSITKIVIDPYDPHSTLNSPVFYVANSDQATNNSTKGTGQVGIWRYDAKGPSYLNGSIWFNLTSVSSVLRTPTPSSSSLPGTPGPDDDFRIQYPQTNANYSDLQIAYDPPVPGVTGLHGSVLYFAQGTAFGYPTLPTLYDAIGLGIPIQGVPVNAVYRFPINQEFYPNLYPYSGSYEYNNPVSFVGTGYIDNVITDATYGQVLNSDAESSTEFLSPLTNERIDDGNIKFTLSGVKMAADGEPSGSVFAEITYPTLAFWNSEDVTKAPTYAFTGSTFELDSSANGGEKWVIDTEPGANTTLTTPPGYQQYQGYYDSTIFAVPVAGNAIPDLYVGGAGSTVDTFNIWESTDGGTTWTDRSIDRNGNGPGDDAHAMFDETEYANGVINNELLVGTDGGLWELNTTTNLWTNLNGADPGSDLNVSQITSISGPASNGGVLVAGTQNSGTVEYTNTQAWNMIDDTQGANQYGGQVAVDQNNSNNVYAFQSNAAAVDLFSSDGQTHDAGGYVLNSYLTTATLRKSTNAGASWSTLVPNPTLPGTGGVDYAQNPPLVLDPVNPSRLLIGGEFLSLNANAFNELLNPVPVNLVVANLAESVDGGNTWVPFLVPGIGQAITSIAISSYQGPFTADNSFPLVTDQGANTYDKNTIYVSNGTVFEVTKNDGVSWQSRPVPLPAGTTISAITVDPTDRDIVYVTTTGFSGGAGHVFQSLNAGQKWTDITSNLPDMPTHAIAVDPRIETTAGAPSGNVYIGNDDGVWELPSGSATWNRVGVGMPNVEVDSLFLNQNLNTLTAGTYGRGSYTYYLDDAVANSGAFAEVSGSSQWTGPVVVGTQSVPNSPTTIGSAGSQVLQNNITAAVLNLIGPISDATGTSNTLNKIGGGTVVFSGPNSYSGQTNIEAGVLVADNPTALGASGVGEGTTVDPGTSLELEANLNLEPVTLNGNGFLYNGHFAGALRNISNNNTYTGTLTLNTNTTIDADSGTSLTIGAAAGGTIMDNGANYNLTKEGTGLVILAMANSYGGATNVNQGALQVRNSGALGAAGTIGNETAVLDGAQLQLFSTSPLLGGTPVIVNGEILSLSGTGINSTGALLNIGGSNTWSGPIHLDVNPGFAPDSLPSGTVSFGVSSAQDTLTLSGGSISDSADPNSVYSGLAKVGPGTLTINQADSYRGTTFINSGVVDIQNGQALAVPPDNQMRQRVTVTSTSAIGSFVLSFQGKVTGSIAFNATAAQVVNALTLLGTIPAGSVSVTRNVVSFTDSTGDLVTYFLFTVEFTGAFGLRNDLPLMVATGSSGATAVVSAVQAGAIGTLVNTGAELEVDGDPTKIGGGTGIAVNSETLGLNGTGVAGGGAVENISGNNSWSGAVTLLNNSSLSPASVTDAIGADGATSITFTGNVQDPTPLTTSAATLDKVGTGTVVFPNANTYGGNTFINNGDLQIENNQSLGQNLPEIQNVSSFGTNGTYELTFNYNGQIQTTIPIAYNATAVQMQSALNSLTNIGANGVSVSLAANVYTVSFTGTSLIGKDLPQLSANPVNFTNGAGASVVTVANGTGFTTVNSGGTLQINGDPKTVGASIVVSDEALFLNGSGYQNAGALENVTGNNSWLFAAGTPSLITLSSNAAIGVDASTTLTDNQQIIDAGKNFGLTKVGTGTLDFTGATGFDNTYTGLTQVNQGTLQLDMTGGATPFRGDLSIGQAAPAIGTAVVQWLNGNQVSSEVPFQNVSTEPTVSVNSNGTLNLNGQTDSIATLVFVDGLATTGSGGKLTVGNLNMTGGSLTTATSNSTLFLAGNVSATSDINQTATLAGVGAVSLDGTTRTFNITSSGFQSSDLLISAPLTNLTPTSGEGIVKTGNGILQLTSNDGSTLIGLTTVQQGSVQVDGTLNEVDLAGGTVSGTGTITDFDNGTPGTAPQGIINPGDNGTGTPTGILTANPTETENWNSGTTLFLDLNDAAAGAGLGYDQLNVNGSINLGGTGATGVGGAQFAGTVGANVNIGDSFTVLQTFNGQITGTFAQPFSPNVTFIGGQKFVVTYTNPTNNPTLPITEVILTREKDTLANFTVSSTVNPSVYGQDFSFTAALTPEAGAGAVSTSDTVTFSLQIGPSSYITQTVNVFYPAGDTTVGMATFDPQNFSGLVLDPGLYPLTVTFNGDNSFSAGSTILAGGQTINKALSIINLSSTPASPVVGQSVTINTSITARAPGVGTPQGTVTFTVDGNTGSPITLDTSGAASLVLPNLGAGTHRIDVSYSGNLDFNGNSTQTDYIVTVGKDTDTVALNASPATSVVGQQVTFSATVSSPGPDTDVPTGTISFYDGALPGGKLLGIQGLDGTGSASLSTSSLPVGSQHIITAVYSGDTEYLANNTSINPFVVALDPTATTLTSSVTPSTYGGAVTFTATVATISPATGTPTGSVQFKIDGASFGSAVTVNSLGQASISLNNLSIKSHTIEADYSGTTSTFAPSSSTLTQVVRAATTTTVTSSEAPSTYGDAVTFTATVVPVSPGTVKATVGTVQFFVDNIAFGNPVSLNSTTPGIAQITLTNLSISASHTIAATYSGDPVNNAGSSSAPLTQIVRSGTSVVVTSSANPSVYGSSVTFTATVGAGTLSPPDTAPTGGGTVTFIIVNNQTGISTTQAPINLPASDKVSITLSSLGLGTYNIIAKYSGTTTTFSPSDNSSSPLVQSVDFNSTTTLTGSPSPSTLGSTVTFKATVAPVSPASITPTGTVQFVIDGNPAGSPVTLVGGVATYSTAALGFGSHTIVAQYSGDTNYVASTFQITQNVVYSSTTSLTSAMNPAVWGAPVNILATVAPSGAPAGSPTPTGTVTFSINGFPQAPVTLSGGVATLAFPIEPVGTYTVTASYSGDTTYGASTQLSSVAQQVNPDTTHINVTSSSNPAGAGVSVTFTATVTSDSPGIAIPTGTVMFSGLGITQTTVALDGNGQATFTTSTLNMGVNSINANYSGSPNSGASSTTFTETVLFGSGTSLSSSLNPSTSGQAVTFTATVSPTAGSANPTGSVQFVIDGHTFGGPVTLNSSDVATLTTASLAIGPHQVVANYSGDGTYAPSSASLSQSVFAGTTTTLSSASNPSVYGQPATIQATVAVVAPGTGTPTSGSVTFFLNNVAQPAVPINSSGVASLDISTLAGATLPYTVTATYSGDNTSYAGSSTTQSLSQTINADGTTTVVTSSANPAGEGQLVTLSATVSPVKPGLATPTGSVQFVIMLNGTTFPTSVQPLINGVATLQRTFLAVGTATITANYLPNPTTNFASSVNTLNLPVHTATTTTLKSSANPTTPGTAVTFTATVKSNSAGAGTPAGTISFYVDGNLQTFVHETTGTASLNVGPLPLGNHSITATYTPDTGSNFASSTGSLTEAVHYSTTAVVRSSENPATIGDPVTFTATLTPQTGAPSSPSGTVTFYIDGKAVQTQSLPSSSSGPVAVSYKTSSLSAAVHSVYVVYSGDSNFASVTSKAVAETVKPVRLVVSVSPSNGVGVNQPFTVTVIAYNALGQQDVNFNGFTASMGYTYNSSVGGGTIAGNLRTTFSRGRAVFSGLTATKVGNYTLEIFAAGLEATVTISTSGRRS